MTLVNYTLAAFSYIVPLNLTSPGFIKKGKNKKSFPALVRLFNVEVCLLKQFHVNSTKKKLQAFLKACLCGLIVKNEPKCEMFQALDKTIL